MDPIVSQIISWSRTYRQAADAAFDAVADSLDADPDNTAKQLDFKQAVQYHSTILNSCSALLTVAMQIVANDAAATLAAIQAGTQQLVAVQANIAKVQKVVDVLADLVTTTADIVTAVTTLQPAKVASAASDIGTLVKDTIGA